MGILDERLKVDGEQDGPVDQEIALSGGDLAAGGLLTEAGARMLQRRIYCEHSFHLPGTGIPAGVAGRDRGFGPYLGPAFGCPSMARRGCDGVLPDCAQSRAVISLMLRFVSATDGIECGSGLDPTVPNVARIYDFMLGGKDNFAADRQLAEQILSNVPTSAWSARQQRAFVVRAVRYCAQRGIGQFLDVGSGLPTMDNVHEVARRVVPDAAVVYVDNDPVALCHGRALLAASPGIAAIWGDAREPQKILDHVETHGLLDLTRPMAVLMTGILHFIADTEDPAGIVQVFRDAIPAGSYLVLSQATDDVRPDDAEYAKDVIRRASAPLLHTRSHSEFAAFFDGLELVDPGLVLTVQWRPEEPVRDLEQAGIYVGIGRKP